MDDFDERDRSRRSDEPRESRRPSRRDYSIGDPIRRRPAGAEPEFGPRRRRDRTESAPDREDIEPRSRRTRLPDEDPLSRRERYADRFRRQPEYQDEEADDRSYRSSRDPYDRLRRVSSRPPRRVEVEYEAEAAFDDYDEELEAVARPRRAPRRPARDLGPRFDQQRIRDVGALIANPAPDVRPLVMGGLAAVASLILLSILIIVRSGSVDDWIPLHLDAEGNATDYGSKSALWRLPFFALLATAMTFGLGWWLKARETYAVQFLIVGALIVHSLIWVGALNLLW